MVNPPWSEVVRSALAEDIGRGDITTNAIIDAGLEMKAVLVAREDMVVCGLPVFSEVFRTVDSRIRIMPHLPDGSGALAGNEICSVRGPARSILTAERVALNFFQNLSAIASLTRCFVEKISGTNARIVDTRKTVPGLRLLQKYAVRIGGGYNHRMGLDDGILIKDNHIASVGSIKEAVRLCRDGVSHLHRIEVECDTLAQVEETLAAGAHIILLDNMDLTTLRQAVAMVGGRALLEASGNITLDNVRQVAETGVDLISVGTITRSAGSRDVTLVMMGE
ncbi:MAG: carboxylating nicotinate-nucleotide diphosphorylase [Magnetococcales bacterium]|nr:carboxylating nicotinate-nucleotide diphosphorylase [Magnetococcales bacterium]